MTLLSFVHGQPNIRDSVQAVHGRKMRAANLDTTLSVILSSVEGSVTGSSAQMLSLGALGTKFRDDHDVECGDVELQPQSGNRMI